MLWMAHNKSARHPASRTARDRRAPPDTTGLGRRAVGVSSVAVQGHRTRGAEKQVSLAGRDRVEAVRQGAWVPAGLYNLLPV